ncbi:hypothetical protein GGI35DRAFT_245231 [Trichoderma velutinum]
MRGYHQAEWYNSHTILKLPNDQPAGPELPSWSCVSKILYQRSCSASKGFGSWNILITMDQAATYSREITSNRFGNNTTIHQGDVHYHSPNDKARDNEDTKCLTDLRTTDPRDDKARIEATKGGLLKDLYRWILEHSDFQQWRDDKRSRLLWIKGDPGKGKTMLLCGIVNELSPQTRLQDQKANTLLSYFFCQAADERINSATAVLRGLTYLVVKQQPLLVSHIQEKYKDGGEAIFKDVNAWTALSDIFLNILKDATLERAYIIIDALDECVTDLPKLLDFINTKSTLCSRVKWIVSSRNWPDIEEGLDSATQQTRLCLELNEKSISAAVNVYIKHQVELLSQKRKYDAITKDAVRHHLSLNSNNTFLWVALVCQNLKEISLQNDLTKLNEFPPGLDSLYERMLKKIHSLKDIRDTKFCYQIFATILLVYRPVTLAELGSLLESPDNTPADAKLINKAIGFCGSFLTVRDSRVYVIHQSAKDYLSGKAASTIFPSSSADVHGVIFARSLQAMSATLRRNIYNLYPPGLPINAIKAPDPDPLAAVRYSCVYWVDHFCSIFNSNSQSQDQVDHKCRTVFLFIRKYFLYWLEALGLMRHIGDGVLSIARLENLLTSSDCQLLELAQDSRRFIRQNSSVIADSPLQVYRSALIFSPLNSLIRKLFEEEEPQWLKVKPVVEYNWSPYLQTLKGHSNSVLSVAFSADGRYVASGSLDRTTIKIWDATTGIEQQTLEGHSGRVCSVAFSADGRYLASGSRDGTIKIWDATTGKERQTLNVNKPIKYISFDNAASYLRTEIGLIKLGIEHRIEAQSTIVAQVMSPDSDPALDQDHRRPIADDAKKPTCFSYGLSTDECWITWNGHNILWLPPEYQAVTSAVWHYAPPSTSPQVLLTDAAIALGNGSGRVVVFRMSGSEPYFLL